MTLKCLPFSGHKASTMPWHPVFISTNPPQNHSGGKWPLRGTAVLPIDIKLVSGVRLVGYDCVAEISQSTLTTSQSSIISPWRNPLTRTTEQPPVTKNETIITSTPKYYQLHVPELSTTSLISSIEGASNVFAVVQGKEANQVRPWEHTGFVEYKFTPRKLTSLTIQVCDLETGDPVYAKPDTEYIQFTDTTVLPNEDIHRIWSYKNHANFWLEIFTECQ